jgi:hypothetical protein
MVPHTSSEAISHADAVRIREALGDVLVSAPFRNTRQCQSFLKYIVEHTLAGENDLLRERVIGTEVFGRSHDYEPSDDPVVRARAAEVRKRLAQYYQTCTDSLVTIDIPPGSYRAVFQWKAAGIATPASPPPDSRRFRWWWVLAAVLLIAAIAMVVRGLRPGPPLSAPSAPSALDQFWAPALTSPKPILVYNATTPVFRSPDLTDSPRGLVPVRNQYMTIGDAYASVALTSLFARKGKLYQLRYGTDLSFSDLRYQPSILIGAFGNAWTMQTTNDLRFVFDKHPTIRDRSDNRLYTLPNMTPDGRTPEDYAIVSRVFDSNTGELLIVAAGITQYGSRAAGEFLTSPQLLAALAAESSGDWPKKNLQVLLHTKIVGDTPGPPTIVKKYFW